MCKVFATVFQNLMQKHMQVEQFIDLLLRESIA